MEIILCIHVQDAFFNRLNYTLITSADSQSENY